MRLYRDLLIVRKICVNSLDNMMCRSQHCCVIAPVTLWLSMQQEEAPVPGPSAALRARSSALRLSPSLPMFLDCA